jgi:hypothetical protein
MKNCKIISTYFGPRRANPKDKSETKILIEDVFNHEITTDPGVDLDVFLVNHDFGDETVKEFLEKYDNKKINRGTFKVINRKWGDGIGGSFKSFSHAFELLKEEYDNWFFTEDDAIIILDGYYKKAIDQLNMEENIAFIGFYRGKPEIGVPTHAHGGCGFTNKGYLNKVFDRLGHLQYSKTPMPIEAQNYIKSNNRDALFSTNMLKDWYEDFACKGEVGFTNEFVKDGYEIKDFIHEEPIIKLYRETSPTFL